MRCLKVLHLGTVPYAQSLELQRDLVSDRQANRIGDTLLLLQHPHIVTLGAKALGRRAHVVATAERLAELGVEVHESGRGGDVTYHGPGQIVGYPILDLRPERCDVHRYVRDLEEVMIRAAAAHRIQAGRIKGLTGAWVGGDKIGAIGVRISRWITSHGFAFNVNTELQYFQLIVPCGITDRGVTSMAALLGHSVLDAEVEASLVRSFCEVFECDGMISPDATAELALGQA